MPGDVNDIERVFVGYTMMNSRKLFRNATSAVSGRPSAGNFDPGPAY